VYRRLFAFDASLSKRLTLSSTSRWRWLARLIAHAGDGPYIFGSLGVIYLLGWFFSSPLLRFGTIIVLCIVLTAMLVVTLIKFGVRRERPRPPGEFVSFHYDIYSFPSGHSARLAALAMGTIFFYPSGGLVLWGFAMAVAAARVAVGVHYVSDIVVGLGVGTLTAWLVANILL
jgi:undecaprenyl-diphosphatase